MVVSLLVSRFGRQQIVATFLESVLGAAIEKVLEHHARMLPTEGLEAVRPSVYEWCVRGVLSNTTPTHPLASHTPGCAASQGTADTENARTLVGTIDRRASAGKGEWVHMWIGECVDGSIIEAVIQNIY